MDAVVLAKVVMAPSFAVSLKANIPGWPKLAVVTAAVGVPNATLPGPLSKLQPRVSGPGLPSSVAVPGRVSGVFTFPATAPPALATGPMFAGTAW